MLRIMLIDTDTDNLKNFKAYIRLSFTDVRVVSQMASAFSYKEKIKENAPNLIIGDIRFFGTATYQTFRDISETNPSMRFILYGTYNDMDYAEKLRDYGLIDFLVRPVKPSDLERSLKNAISITSELEKIDLKQKTQKEIFLSRVPVFKDIFLRNLVNGQLVSSNEIEYSLTYFGLSIKPPYTVVQFNIDHFQQVILALDDNEKFVMVNNAYEAINTSVLNNRKGLCYIENLHTIVAILSKTDNFDEVFAYCEKIKNELKPIIPTGITVTIGRAYNNYSGIYTSFRETNAAIRYRYLVGYNSIIPIHFVEPTNMITHKYPLEKEDLLVFSAISGEYSFCDKLLHEITEFMKQINPLPEMMMPKIMMKIIMSINKYATEQNISLNSQFTQIFNPKDIYDALLPEDSYQVMTKALKEFCGLIVDIKNKAEINVANIAKDYVDNNFSEQITISRLAHHAKTTAEYLTNAFKKHIGTGIMDYLRFVRVENVKRLITETGESDDVIAVKTGYEDANQLRAVFKQREKMTTSEFRVTLKKQ